MGWEDEHLHQFTIHGKRFGLAQPGGFYFSDDPHQVRLEDFIFGSRNVSLYEYDLIDHWQQQLRLEKILPLDPTKTYPCVSLLRKTPPEDSGGPDQFMEQEVKRGISLCGTRNCACIEIM